MVKEEAFLLLRLRFLRHFIIIKMTGGGRKGAAAKE